MLTALDEKGLVMMFKALFGQVKSPKVAVRYNPNKGIHFAVAKLKDADRTVFLWEQNPNRSSLYADAARKGIPIAWPMWAGEGSDYIGPVLAQLPGRDVEIYDGNELRLLLNPIIKSANIQGVR